MSWIPQKIGEFNRQKKSPEQPTWENPAIFPHVFSQGQWSAWSPCTRSSLQKTRSGGVSPIFFVELFLKFQQQKMQDIKRNSEL